MVPHPVQVRPPLVVRPLQVVGQAERGPQQVDEPKEMINPVLSILYAISLFPCDRSAAG